MASWGSKVLKYFNRCIPLHPSGSHHTTDVTKSFEGEEERGHQGSFDFFCVEGAGERGDERVVAAGSIQVERQTQAVPSDVRWRLCRRQVRHAHQRAIAVATPLCVRKADDLKKQKQEHLLLLLLVLYSLSLVVVLGGKTKRGSWQFVATFILPRGETELSSPSSHD